MQRLHVESGTGVGTRISDGGIKWNEWNVECGILSTHIRFCIFRVGQQKVSLDDVYCNYIYMI